MLALEPESHRFILIYAFSIYSPFDWCHVSHLGKCSPIECRSICTAWFRPKWIHITLYKDIITPPDAVNSSLAMRTVHDMQWCVIQACWYEKNEAKESTIRQKSMVALNDEHEAGNSSVTIPACCSAFAIRPEIKLSTLVEFAILLCDIWSLLVCRQATAPRHFQEECIAENISIWKAARIQPKSRRGLYTSWAPLFCPHYSPLFIISPRCLAKYDVANIVKYDKAYRWYSRQLL